MSHIKSIKDLQDLMFENLMGSFIAKEEDIEELEKLDKNEKYE